MKNTLVKSGLVLLLLSAVFVPVRVIGQPQVIGLYFDRALTQRLADCPETSPGTIDTLYLAVHGFTTPIEGIEFQISFPPQMPWIGDVELDNGLWIGNPVEGRMLAFFSPVDASSPVIIQEFVVIWLCEGCTTTDIVINIAPYQGSGLLRAVTSDLEFEDVIGLTSVVCPEYICKGCKDGEITTTARATSAIPASAQCVLDCPAGDGGVILPGTLPGEHHTPDLDGDGLVSIVDFAHFAPTVYMMIPFDPDMDFYCSGNIDLIDFVLFTRHWEHSNITPVVPSTWGNIKARYSD